MSSGTETSASIVTTKPPAPEPVEEKRRTPTPVDIDALLKSAETADCYDDDVTELKFLLSNPTCFVVLGKPGAGKTAVARKISQNWHCELVSPTEVILQNIEMETEMGVKAREMLYRGEAVPEEMVAKMIEDKIKSPEVAHHGYVLDGLPSLSEDYMTIKDQLEHIKNFKLKPDFIVHVKIPDSDLEKRRVGQRVDPLTGDIYTIEVYNPDKPEPKKKEEGEEDEEEEEAEEEQEEEEGGEGVNVALPQETVSRLLIRPEDLPEHVTNNVSQYRSSMLRILEDHMADHDQQYLLELDANQTIQVLEKQILAKLNCFNIRPAAVAVRLNDAEEEEISEDMETDELMRTLGPKNMVAPRFRWRRSRWLRYCPVALQEGQLIPGRQEFACGFLDKVYLMSTPEAFAKFLKNPRPYILPPQPRPPAKFAVMGPPHSGTTTLSSQLAERYGAKIVDVQAKLRPKIAEEKEKYIQTIVAETTETAIEQVKKKLKDAAEAAAEAARQEAERLAAEEAERLAREAAEKEAAAAEAAAAAAEAGEGAEGGEEGEKTAEQPGEQPAEDGAAEGEAQEDGEKGEEGADDPPAEEETPKPHTPTPPPEIEVDATHEEVVAIVQKAVKLAEQNPVTLSAEVIVELVEEAIKDVEEQVALRSPDGPRAGGWILDNFPQNREQWSIMQEKNIMPDDVVFLKDNSEGGSLLLKRWYALNKETVDEQIASRLAKEAEVQRLQQEELRKTEAILWRREEEEKRLAEEAEKKRKSDERARRIENGEDPVEVDREIYGIIPETLSVQFTLPISSGETAAGESEIDASADPSRNTLDEAPSQPNAVDSTEDKVGSVASDTPAAGAVSSTESVVPPPDASLPKEGPELEAAREKRKEWDREGPSIEGVFSSTGVIEPITLEIEETTIESVMKQAVEKIEKRFEYNGWEYTGMDLDEEEEDNAAEAEQNEEEVEEEEEEEEGDPNRNKKKPLGDLNHFCPVALLEKNVLWPGNPECSAKYREKVYYLSNDDNRTKFLENPSLYLNKEKPPQPPAVRLLCLGAKGSGKSLHGRQLAKKHKLFHIQFEERLQEMLMKKTKKLVGPYYEAEEEFKDTPEDNDEDKELDEFEKTFTMADLDIEEKEAGEEGAEEGGEEGAAGAEAEDDSKEEPKSELGAQTILGSSNTTMDRQSPSQKGVRWKNMSSADMGKGHSADEDDEAEEEAEIEYTEEEEAIKAYLEGGMEEMLPGELLEKIIGEFWDKDPFKGTGFIMEGFPRTADEVRWMAESGYFPDTAITIQSEDTDIIGRLLPPKMELWKAKRDRKLKRKQRQKEKAKKLREKDIEKRRRELVKEREKKAEEKRAEKEAAKAEQDEEEEEAEEEAEEEEEEEEEDIEAILAEEFEAEEEEDEDEEETEEDARDRLSNDLAEIYDNDTNRLSSVTEALEDTLIPHIEVEGGRKPHIIRYQLSKSLKTHVEYRESMFERVYPINEKLADRMIAVGYKQPSRFGRWCPVQLSEGGCIQPMHGPGFPSFPALYRGYVYYLSTQLNREQFMANPLSYLKQPSPKPVVPIRMAIVGPPKSGKTTLARRFESEYGVVRVSLGDAMRTVLTNQPKTDLACKVQEVLRSGQTVPDDLAIAALQVALMDMNCATRGYILDGFPVNSKQVELMTAASIIPVRVIELACSNMEIMVRSTKDRLDPERKMTYPKHDSAQIVTVKINSFHKNIEEIRKWYNTQHMNYDLIKVEKSKWWVWNEALDIARNSVKTIQIYLERVARGQAACVYDLCITPTEFKARLGDFRHYCPVSMASGELVDCSVTESLQYSVEFRGHYYKCAGEKERDMFLSEPEIYVPPLAPIKLPSEDMLPKRITGAQAKAMFPMQVELKGYCPVTFLDGKLRYEAIIPGNLEIGCVLYKNKLYIFQSEVKLLKFLRLPDKYWNLKLPHKLPPRKEPMNVTGLPMLGYMEQTVAQAVTKAMTRCGCFKPKYPFLTATQSALIYIAYHLKAFNPKSSEYVRRKYKKKLEKFEETCNLIRYLGDNMTVRYKEPEARPIDFNFKLDQFLQLNTHQAV